MIFIKNSIFSAIVLLAHTLCLAEDVSTNRIQVQEFELKDQFKKVHKQAFPKKRVSIFALADRKGSDQLEKWITPFYKRYEDRVDVCGVANLKGLPKVLRPMMRGLFKKGVNYPVMMDWKGEISEDFDYQAGVADIFIISTEGFVVHRVTGEATPEKLNACYLIVDDLIKTRESSGNTEKSGATQKEEGPPAKESTTDAPAKES